MAIELEKKDRQYFENRKRRYKRMLTFLILSLLIIAAFAIAFFYLSAKKHLLYRLYINW